MSEVKSIKETLEVLEALKVIAVGIKAIIADGKVSVSDLPALIKLATNIGTFSRAVEGANEVPKELKDIDAAEAEILVAKCLEIGKVFVG